MPHLTILSLSIISHNSVVSLRKNTTSSSLSFTSYLFVNLLISKYPLKISPSIETVPEFNAAFSVAEILGNILFIFLNAYSDIILIMYMSTLIYLFLYIVKNDKKLYDQLLKNTYLNTCDDSSIALSIRLTFVTLLDMYVSPKYLYSI